MEPFPEVNESQVESILQAMTLEEKIGQLIIWTPDLDDFEIQKSALKQIKRGRAGGLLPQQMKVGDYLVWMDSLKRAAAIPLILGTDQKVSLHNQFEDLQRFPKPFSISAIDSFEVQQFLEEEYLEQCKSLGINFSILPTLPAPLNAGKTFNINHFEYEPRALKERSERMIAQLAQNKILAFASGFSSLHIESNDSLRAVHLHDMLRFASNGLQGLVLQDEIFENEGLKASQPRSLQHYLSDKVDFHGLSMVKLLDGESPELKLLQGADLLLAPNIDNFYHYAMLLLREGRLTEEGLDKRVRRILTAKAWVTGGELPVELSVMPRDSIKKVVKLVSFASKQPPQIVRKYKPSAKNFYKNSENIQAYFNHPAWKVFVRGLFEKSVTLASDVNKMLPFNNILEKDFQVFEFGNSNFRQFKYYFSKYADFRSVQLRLFPEGGLPVVNFENLGDQPVAVILIDSIAISQEQDKHFIQSVNGLSNKMNVILVNFGNPLNLGFFEKSITFLQIYERNKWTESHAAQALFGGVSVNGKLPIIVNDNLPFAASEFIRKERIGFSRPEKAGIAPERLVGIDAIARTAIQNRVFPGCQVALVKDGQMIYSKAFGYHTYTKEQATSPTDLYDIASVSKIAATTLSVMRLHERNKIALDESIGQYVNLEEGARVGNIKIKDLLIHQSGLQAPMPISKFYNYRSVPPKGCNDIFCHDEEGAFNIQVGPELYFREDYRDTIWKRVFNLSVSQRRAFRYSDVNFYLLQKAVENIGHVKLDNYVQNNIYHTLGLRRMLYNPLDKFDLNNIVPTEQDRMWRKSLIHGFVHDPSAALMGGVGGNAGLFANAEDMAVLFQMMANKGIYGGIQYFEPKTIQTFTNAKHGARRGLGFDKPINRKYPTYSDKTPSSAYGHTGFTGTCVWIDPENDLVYVFLSNRIHPSARNKKIFTERVRRRIHEVAYDAFNSFDPTLPTLDSK